MELHTLVFTIIIGLLAGSFLNVMGLRLLEGKNFIQGRSKCPKCAEIIRWYDNLPLLSYIMLRGKCRHCSAVISPQYPLVEFFTVAMFIVSVYSFGVSLKTLFILYLICNFIVIMITDIREKYIFDINSIPLIPIGLIYNYFNIGKTSSEVLYQFSFIQLNDIFVSALIGAVAGAAFFEIFSRLGLVLAGEMAFGSGDSILAAGLGAWFGWEMMIAILALSFLSQLFVGLPVIVYNMYKANDRTSLIATVVLLFSVGLTFVGRYFTYSGRPFLAMIIIFSAFIIAGISIMTILKRTKERRSHTFLPFGPSLVFAGFMVIFFAPQLRSFLPF